MRFHLFYITFDANFFYIIKSYIPLAKNPSDLVSADQSDS